MMMMNFGGMRINRRQQTNTESSRQAGDMASFRRHQEERRQQEAAAAAGSGSEMSSNENENDASSDASTSSNNNANATSNNNANGDANSMNEETNYEGDYAASDFNFHERLAHFMDKENVRIDSVSRKAVEITLLLEAGSIVTSEATSSNEDKYKMMEEKYIGFVDGIHDIYFSNLNTKNLMKQKLYQAHEPITGKRLWEKFNEYRKEIRTEYIGTTERHLPMNLATLSSGNQLRDAWNNFTIRSYREVYVSTSLSLCSLISHHLSQH
jgi:hypothetical protein